MTSPAEALRPSYPTEDAALKRVEVLKSFGIWPGYVRLPDGRWQLLYDPDVYR